jgi:2-polyprenyl-3-methyl-5-hydroxy-6-metoxy-1,4-benzoquinol methylase
MQGMSDVAVASSYAEGTIQHRHWLKRFSHRRRYAAALRLLRPQAGERILDFGAGDGYLASQLARRHASLHVVAYEPMPSMLRQCRRTLAGARNALAVANLTSLDAAAFDKIACLEVLEHLPPQPLADALHALRQLVHAEGRIVVSVPLEVGPASLAKNLARCMLRQRHPGTTWRTVLRAAVGLPIRRDISGPYIYSHVGFDHRTLPGLFQQAGLRVVRRCYSPLGWLRGLLNSQVFFVLRRRS